MNRTIITALIILIALPLYSYSEQTLKEMTEFVKEKSYFSGKGVHKFSDGSECSMKATQYITFNDVEIIIRHIEILNCPEGLKTSQKIYEVKLKDLDPTRVEINEHKVGHSSWPIHSAILLHTMGEHKKANHKRYTGGSLNKSIQASHVLFFIPKRNSAHIKVKQALENLIELSGGKGDLF